MHLWAGLMITNVSIPNNFNDQYREDFALLDMVLACYRLAYKYLQVFQEHQKIV